MSAGNDRYYLSEAEKKQFHEEGYLIAKGLFQPDEVAEIKETFMRIQAEGVLPGYFEPASPEEAKGDPLKLFPRILYPHRVIGRAKSYMLHPPVMALLKELFQEE
ncbi:phytanoyl-CoA dioxygenase family protein, partial [Paenibacillus sepulcri]|nr:phytanoyl-CoA dioxygenase family protein [Paenibacillus sepulcri]